VPEHLANVFQRNAIVEHHICEEVAGIMSIEPSDIAIDIPDFA